MAVVSDSKSASEMRDEVVENLMKRHKVADSEARQIRSMPKLERARREGFAAALRVEIDFWKHVWVEGKRWEPKAKKYDMQGTEIKDNA